jgi:hypothetical protein
LEKKNSIIREVDIIPEEQNQLDKTEAKQAITLAPSISSEQASPARGKGRKLSIPRALLISSGE